MDIMMDTERDKEQFRNLFGATDAREYVKSHPWLTFELHLEKAPPRFWTLLGECQSKCEHLAGVPLRPSAAQHLMQIYLAKGVLASAAIEGNTLTEEEAIAHVEGTLKIPPSREYLQREIDNILKLHNEVAKDILQGMPPPFSLTLLKDYNKRVLDGLEVGAHVVPGEIPKVEIGVGRYRGAPRGDCEYLLDRLSTWLNGNWSSPGILEPIAGSIVKAIIAHLYFVWIHPFGDGNGRTARMIEVQVLLQSGVPQPACQLMSNHYNKTRDRYNRELERASASGGDPVPFLLYAIEGFRDGLKEQISMIRIQQWHVSWLNYVHDRFTDLNSPSDLRRKHLVLDLDRHYPKLVTKGKMSEVSPRIAATYATLDEKTLSRDIDWLQKQELIRRDGEGYVANRERILAFLPRLVVIGDPKP